MTLCPMTMLCVVTIDFLVHMYLKFLEKLEFNSNFTGYNVHGAGAST